MEWLQEQLRYTDYVMSRSPEERLAMLRGLYHLEQVTSRRLPDLARFAPDASFQRETLAQAADEIQHEHAFKAILLRVGDNMRESLPPPYSLGALLIEKALHDVPKSSFKMASRTPTIRLRHSS